MATEGTPYTGFLYAGLVLTDSGPTVLEFNCRLGDPETQVVMPRMESDLIDLIEAGLDGRVVGPEWNDLACLNVVLAAPGYPEAPWRGAEVIGDLPDGALVFHAGTGEDENGLFAQRWPGPQRRRNRVPPSRSPHQCLCRGRKRSSSLARSFEAISRLDQVKVAIVMGSGSDRPVMEKAGQMLDRFGIESVTQVLSAHKTPDQAIAFAEGAASAGFQVIIAGAGKAAHLAGVMAAKSLLPVIGVPLSASLDGLDALLSTVQMPTGIPVATVAVDGSTNAALLAVAILALGNEELTHQLADYRAQLAADTLAG